MSARVSRGLVAGVIVIALATGCGAAHDPSAAVPTSTAPVVRTDIVSRQELTGTLTFAGSYTLINQAAGVYTSLPSAGAVVSRGQVLYRVDSRPVSLFYGAPEWRTLTVGVPDGSDVTQLEQNLLALGFGNSSNLIANGHFDSFDAAAVRRWQASLGVPQTGVVNLGDVIYQPGPIRVASVHPSAAMGAQPGQPVIDATSTQRAVIVALDVNREALVKVGDSVTVSLPNSATPVAGTVSAIGTVATSSSSSGEGPPGPPSVPMTITLGDPAAAGSLDQAQVGVGVTNAIHRAVLAVPVMALIAQPGGTYAVEVVDGSARHEVAVTTGLFDDRGLVEVTSTDLREGMLVEVPQS